MTNGTTLGVANDHESKVQKSEADDSHLSAVLSPDFNLGFSPSKTCVSSSKSRPRLASVQSRLAGSQEMRTVLMYIQ